MLLQGRPNVANRRGFIRLCAYNRTHSHMDIARAYCLHIRIRIRQLCTHT